MITEIRYQFSNEPAANRFLNELKHWSLHDVKARLNKRASQVKVSYEFDGRGFDYTCSDLDSLASQYGGSEV